MSWRIHWFWRNWAFHHLTRFNSGNPYESIRIGPLEIRKYMK